MKRRKRPEHSWDRLNGTRLEVVELDAGAVHPFAPEAAARVGKGAPENGWHWGVFVAFNGTTLAILDPPRMEATA